MSAIPYKLGTSRLCSFLLILVASLCIPLKAQNGASSPILGQWEWKGEIGWQKLILDLKADKGKLTGTITMGPGPGDSANPEDYWEYFFHPGVFEITNGALRGETLTFEQVVLAPQKSGSYQDGGIYPEMKLKYSGKLEGERLILVRELRDPLATLNAQSQRFEIAMTRPGSTSNRAGPSLGEPISLLSPTSAMTDVLVQDPSSRFVSSLRKEDFQVREEGVSREILSVAPPDTPWNIIFLFDMDALLLTAQAYSGNPTFASRGAENAQETLKLLGNGIATFYRSLRIQDRLAIDCFLDDRTARMLPWRSGGLRGEWTASQPYFEHRPVAEKDLYRAIRVAVERLRGARGRSMVVLISDGRDGRLNGTFFRTKQRMNLVDPFYGLPNTDEMREFEAILDAVQKSSVLFFVASVNGDRPYEQVTTTNSVWGFTSMGYVPDAEKNFPSLHQTHEERLNRLARISGGAVISRGKPTDAGSSIANLAQRLALGQAYRITYASSINKSTDVKVSVRDRQLRVQSVEPERLEKLQ